MFVDSNIQLTSDIVDIIRNYNNGNNIVSESILDGLKVLNIRRDSAESYYLIPVLIFILKDYVDRIQK
jgi:hypothetical protein